MARLEIVRSRLTLDRVSESVPKRERTADDGGRDNTCYTLKLPAQSVGDKTELHRRERTTNGTDRGGLDSEPF